MITGAIAGRLGKDAVTRSTANGSMVTFGIASDRKIKGEKHTQWVDCAWFGKRAEAVAQYLTKGKQITVSFSDMYQHEHNGRTYLKAEVSNVALQGGGERGGGYDTDRDGVSGGYNAGGGDAYGGSATNASTFGPDYGPDDDDIPF